MKVIVVRTDGTHYQTDVRFLEDMQKIVGGFIEVYRLEDIYVVCNGEGRLKNLPDNPILGDFVGDCFLIGTGKDDFKGLFPSQIVKWAARLNAAKWSNMPIHIMP